MLDEDKGSNCSKGSRHGQESTAGASRALLEAALEAYTTEALSGPTSPDEILRIISWYQQMLRLIRLMGMEDEIQKRSCDLLAITKELDAATGPVNFSPKASLLNEILTSSSSRSGEETRDSKRKARANMDFGLQQEDSDFSYRRGVHEIDPSQLDEGYGSDDGWYVVEPLVSDSIKEEEDDDEDELLRALKWNEQKNKSSGHDLTRWGEWDPTTYATAQAKMAQCPTPEDREHHLQEFNGLDADKYQDAEESSLSPDGDELLGSLETVDEHELVRQREIFSPMKNGGPPSASGDSRCLAWPNGRLFDPMTGSDEGSNVIEIVHTELWRKVNQDLPSLDLPTGLLAPYLQLKVDIDLREVLDRLRRLQIGGIQSLVNQAQALAKQMKGRNHRPLQLELHKRCSVLGKPLRMRSRKKAGSFRVAKSVGPRAYRLNIPGTWSIHKLWPV